MNAIRPTIGFIANAVAWKYRQMLTRVIRQCGYDITPEHWILLAALRTKDSMSQIELARSTYKDKANVTRLLKRLLKSNLVRRERSTEDRRHFKVSLTTEGRKLLRRLTPKLRAATQAVDDHLGEDKVELLKRELTSLSNHLDEMIPRLDQESADALV